MHSIFFEKKAVVICSLQDKCLNDPNGVILYNKENSDLSDIPSLLESSSELTRLYLPAADVDGMYRSLCSCFTEINAGGGLVSNSRGEYLLIYRDDVWDLPKGKQEPDEDIKDTAIREVGEECGITNLSLGELICITHHTYHRDGLFMLKHTHWFKMTENSKETLHPQIEEHISNAKWVPAEEVESYLQDSYPSIQEVASEIRR